MTSFNFSGFTRRPRRSRPTDTRPENDLPKASRDTASKAEKARPVRGETPVRTQPPRHVQRDGEAVSPRGRGRRSTGGAKRPTAAPPPVLVRTDWVNSASSRVPVQPRSHNTPRRRFDVALNVPGAEVRLPALPTVRVGWRLASGLLVIALLGLLVHLWTSPDYQVVLVETEGLQRVTSTDIETVLGLAGQSIFTINPAALRQELVKAFPELMTVSVKVSLPGRVVVSALERQPVIAWEQDGRQTWVDAEGVGFSPRGEVGQLISVQARALPPQPGNQSATPETNPALAQFMLPPDLVAAIQTMAVEAPEGTVMLYDPDHGLGWLDARGWQAYFGMDLEMMKDKLSVYKALADRLLQDGVRPAMISVEYLHAPYYRLER